MEVVAEFIYFPIRVSALKESNMGGKLKRYIAFIIVFVFILNGCVSYSVYKESKEIVAIKKASVAGNDDAVGFIRSGGKPYMYDINVSSREVISERLPLQIGAFLADLLIVWGGVEGARWLSDKSLEKQEKETNQNLNITINVNCGEESQVAVDDKK
jgi:hypothetical protein